MLQKQTKKLLFASKNLLAFSAGGDSTALLFLLLENGINFDIAIVDYGVREQSKEEVAYAKALAEEHGFGCYLKTASSIEKNFEATARKIRYDFFEELIEKYKYDTLLTAHHLGDRLEWFLMQFCKGAGCAELSGMQTIEQRENYKLVRPLLEYDKVELLNYLDQHNLKYFEDESNSDPKYTRNFFRHNFAQPLLEQYKDGIKRSFNYLDTDVDLLIDKLEPKVFKELAYFKTQDKRSNLVNIDRYLKSIGHMITANEKLQLLEEESVVIGRKYIVAQTKKFVFIAPYKQEVKLGKELKEKFRCLGVPVKLRSYLASDDELLALVSLLFE